MVAGSGAVDSRGRMRCGIERGQRWLEVVDDSCLMPPENQSGRSSASSAIGDVCGRSGRGVDWGN